MGGFEPEDYDALERLIERMLEGGEEALE
jgi:hypothetical protein